MSDASSTRLLRTVTGPTGWGGRAPGLAAAFVVVASLVAVAAWQVGPAPAPADSGLPKSPPPLALPSDVPDGAPLARAAVLLAAGRLDAARSGFVDVVAEDQDGVPGQVGLVLSRWRSTGPQSVERDLRQLVLEYPESAFASLHLGLVQLLLGDQRAARATLRDARELGRSAADPTSLRMARLADDVLHPQAFRGTLPVLVQPAEVPPAQRRLLARLLEAVRAGDPRLAVRLASQVAPADAAMLRVAAAASSFDKDTPATAVDRLAALAASPSTPPAARDRARLMRAMADLWGGGERRVGCTRLAALTSGATDRGTRRLAVPIHHELCVRG